MYTLLERWPGYSSKPEDIRKLYGASLISNDLEWDANEKPDVLGLSTENIRISVPYDAGMPYFHELMQKCPDAKLLGYNIVGADMLVLARLGIELDLSRVEDAIIYHWLVNMHLCKSSSKGSMEEDEGDRRGRGFMNLGTFASIYTDLPYWKACRGETCEGPCPDRKCPNYRTSSKYHYNALDCYAVSMGFPNVKRVAQLRGVDKLYPMHRELMWVLANMRDYGVRVNVPFVNDLRSEFEQEKRAIEGTLPFNPDSPKQVVEYFKGRDIALDNAQEQTIRDAVEEFGEEGEGAPGELVALLDYKELGNGVDRWFQPQYRDKNGWLQGFLDERGWVHPHLGMFTSSTRLMCVSPNLQNVSKRRRSRKICECGHVLVAHVDACTQCSCASFRGLSLGKRVREAIIAPEGWYIVRADKSNAENRVVLYRSGYTIPREVDLHEEVRREAGITEEMEISRVLGGARDAAKSIQHANNILEGLQLKSPEELRSPRIRKEIAISARTVFPDWTFCKKIVTFTGANLAQRAFGDKSHANRIKALAISEQYFKRFPGVRKFQQEVSRSVERENVVRTPHGYVLLSYGPDPNDRMKIAQGVQQQSPVAHEIKLSLLNMWARWKRQGNYRPVLSVHDENLAYVKESVDPRTAMEWIREDMEVTTPEMPGLLIPVDPSYGASWRAQKSL